MTNIRTLSLDEKTKLHQENESFLKGMFNIYWLYNEMKKEDIQTYHDFLHKGKKLNLSLLLNFPRDQKGVFECFLFNNHQGWVYEGSQQKFRYITQCKETKTIYYLDIVDLLEIYFGKDIEYILRYLLKGEYEWQMAERGRLERNLHVLASVKEPQLVKLKAVYNFIHQRALQYDVCSLISNEDKAVYFLSTRYIAKAIGHSATKVNQDLHLLHELGLISLLEEKQLSKAIKKTKSLRLKKEKYFKDTHAFIIRNMDDCLSSIEEKIQALTRRKKRIPTEKRKELNEKNVREFLVNRMSEYGFLSKELLEREEYPHLRDALFLMEKMFTKRKPTKRMKETFALKSNQYVYVYHKK